MNNTLFWKSALVFSLFLFGFSKWQTSEHALAEFEDICSSNYNHSQSYYECMEFFNKEKVYFAKIDKIAYVVGVVSTLILGKNIMDAKKIHTKKKEVAIVSPKKVKNKKTKKPVRKS